MHDNNEGLLQLQKRGRKLSTKNDPTVDFPNKMVTLSLSPSHFHQTGLISLSIPHLPPVISGSSSPGIGEREREREPSQFE